VLVAVRDRRRDLERETRLAAAAGAGHRQQADVTAPEQSLSGGELGLATDERGGRDRKVGREQRAQRRELAIPQLVDPRRHRKVLEPVLAEVLHVVSAREIAGRLREQDLAPVRGVGDARRPVHVLADVPVCGHGRLTRVQSHPHAHRSFGKCPLTILRRRHGI